MGGADWLGCAGPGCGPNCLVLQLAPAGPLQRLPLALVARLLLHCLLLQRPPTMLMQAQSLVSHQTQTAPRHWALGSLTLGLRPSLQAANCSSLLPTADAVIGSPPLLSLQSNMTRLVGAGVLTNTTCLLLRIMPVSVSTWYPAPPNAYPRSRYFLLAPDSSSIALTLSSRVLLSRSALPFCCGVYGMLFCDTTPASASTRRNLLLTYSPPLSDLSCLSSTPAWRSSLAMPSF